MQSISSKKISRLVNTSHIVLNCGSQRVENIIKPKGLLRDVKNEHRQCLPAPVYSRFKIQRHNIAAFSTKKRNLQPHKYIFITIIVYHISQLLETRLLQFLHGTILAFRGMWRLYLILPVLQRLRSVWHDDGNYAFSPLGSRRKIFLGCGTKIYRNDDIWCGSSSVFYRNQWYPWSCLLYTDLVEENKKRCVVFKSIDVQARLTNVGAGVPADAQRGSGVFTLCVYYMCCANKRKMKS